MPSFGAAGSTTSTPTAAAVRRRHSAASLGDGQRLIAKPVDLDQFVEVVRAIADFWLTVVRLPRGSGERPAKAEADAAPAPAQP